MKKGIFKKCKKSIIGTKWSRHGFKKCNKTKSQFKKGELHPNYIDGRKSEIYPKEFNIIKEEIKKGVAKVIEEYGDTLKMLKDE